MVVVVAGGGRLPPGTAEDALGLNIYIYIYPVELPLPAYVPKNS